jgi:hypothetical protein
MRHIPNIPAHGAPPPDASTVPYTPAVPADWPVVPNDVAEALDELAAGLLSVFGPITTDFDFANYPSGALILIDTATVGAIAGTLPAAAGRRGTHYRIKDIVGNLSIAAFTVIRAAAEDIENVAVDYIFVADYGALHIACDGTDWWVL